MGLCCALEPSESGENSEVGELNRVYLKREQTRDRLKR